LQIDICGDDGMKYTALRDVCEINMGQSPDSSSYNEEGRGIPFFQGNADFGERNPVTRVWCDAPSKIANANDILISVRAPIGAVNYASETCCIGRGLAAITPDLSRVSSEYIFWLLKGKNAELNSKGTGSTFKAINRKALEEIQVPDISFEKQAAYAANLETAYRIIQMRNQQLSALDDLIKARFVEMFGTYPSNEKRWPTGTIRDLVTEVRYGSSRKAAEGDSGKYPYLRMNNINYSGELDLSETKTIDIPDEELDKCTVHRGDLLFNRTNSKELVGKTCVYNRDELMVLAGFVVRVRLNEKALPEFVSAFMNSSFSKQMLLGTCKAAIGQANINAQELQNIGIYIPPIAMQREFVSFKEQIDKSKYDI
jgi:type I restriction enzyme S subunit